MAEHYCKEHRAVWFMKGKMKNFAHPVLDDEGEPVLGEDGKAVWCNEPKEEKPKQIESKYQRGSPEERNSIESQVAFKGAIELLVGKVIDSKHPLAHTALNYAASKLGNWSSMGDLPDNTQALKEQAKDKVYAQVAQLNKSISAEEVIKDLRLIIDSKKITSPEVVHILREGGAKGDAISAMVKNLSPEGLVKFAARVKPLVPSKLAQRAVEEGIAEIDPRDLPF